MYFILLSFLEALRLSYRVLYSLVSLFHNMHRCDDPPYSRGSRSTLFCSGRPSFGIAQLVSLTGSSIFSRTFSQSHLYVPLLRNNLPAELFASPEGNDLDAVLGQEGRDSDLDGGAADRDLLAGGCGVAVELAAKRRGEALELVKRAERLEESGNEGDKVGRGVAAGSAGVEALRGDGGDLGGSRVGSRVGAEEELGVTRLDGVLECLAVLGLLGQRLAEVVGLGSDSVDREPEVVGGEGAGDVVGERSDLAVSYDIAMKLAYSHTRRPRRWWRAPGRCGAWGSRQRAYGGAGGSASQR